MENGFVNSAVVAAVVIAPFAIRVNLLARFYLQLTLPARNKLQTISAKHTKHLSSSLWLIPCEQLFFRGFWEINFLKIPYVILNRECHIEERFTTHKPPSKFNLWIYCHKSKIHFFSSQTKTNCPLNITRLLWNRSCRCYRKYCECKRDETQSQIIHFVVLNWDCNLNLTQSQEKSKTWEENFFNLLMRWRYTTATTIKDAQQ